MAETGRPSKLTPEMVEQARKLCELGATNEELADFFEVSIATVYRWIAQNPKFSVAVRVGKEAADERVKRSLYHKALGYTYEAEKVVIADGQPVKVTYREHVPPSDTAAIFWLKNRIPAEWRDRVVHACDPEQPLIPKQEPTSLELARAMLAVLAKAEKAE